MVDEEELRRMSPQERLQLRRMLAALDDQDLRASKLGERRRKIILVVIILCCLGLAAWIGVLATTLPRYYRAGGWRGAWVGFDLAELAAFAVTGWAAWRRRQILIICLVVLATLLCCDAWFDVLLDAGTSDVWLSIASALVVELPLAFLMFNAARRLIRLSAVVAVGESGDSSDCDDLPTDALPPLWKIPLFGVSGQPGEGTSVSRDARTGR